MTPDIFFTRIVEPTLAYMDKSPSISIPTRPSASVLVMAIAGQESFWKDRRQIGMNYYPQKTGARGYWQFESTWGGPVAINDLFQKTPRQLSVVCASLDVAYDEYAVYEACAWNDTLACAMARLLLWIHPAPLPAIGEKEAAWQYYLDQWRPGTPHRHTWDARYDAAVAAVGVK